MRVRTHGLHCFSIFENQGWTNVLVIGIGPAVSENNFGCMLGTNFARVSPEPMIRTRIRNHAQVFRNNAQVFRNHARTSQVVDED